jgi:toluene methyl-monooxygenase electron transfer component
MFSFFSSKGPFKAKVSQDNATFVVETGDNLLKAALSNGLAWPHNCRVGSCGECKCRLVSGKIKPLSDFSYVLTGEEMDAGMILACQTSLRSDVEIEVNMVSAAKPLSKPKNIEGEIVNTKSLTHDILEVTIRLDEAMPDYLAGQYAELSILSLNIKPRSYSFARAPEKEADNHVTFYIRHVPEGEFTGWLHSSNRQGERVSVNGPYGSFWLRDSTAQVLCIAGGSGMAPIKALLEQMSTEGMNRQVIYLFGARTQKDLYCLEEMNQIKALGNGHFNFVPVLSQEPEDSNWDGLRGRCIDALPSFNLSLANTQAYLCGPPGMIDGAIEMLTQNGMSTENIFYDKFLDASTMKGGRK